MIWNPWKEKAAEIADLPNSAYKEFVCIEAACLEPVRRLGAGDPEYLINRYDAVAV